MNFWFGVVLGSLLVAIPLVFTLRKSISGKQQLQSRVVSMQEDLQRLQQTCARLAPGDVADRIVDGDVTTAAERREATALFADLVGYTAMSEQLEPQQLARVLNGYFEAMSDAITRNRGHISTFIGDGILAYFGALEPNPWQCNDAAHAALAMRENLQKYNMELAAGGLPQLALGVGLHHGPGLAGMVGSRERMEYAFVGRTVNLSARVQTLTRMYQVDILVTQAVRDKLDPAFDLSEMPPTPVKGIDQPVVTYALEGYRLKDGPPDS